MSQQPLPPNCYDATHAANKLGISNKQLLKKMRDLGWLINAPKTTRHNLPLRALEIRGFLTTQDRHYTPKTKHGRPENVVRTYRITLITKKGYEQLKAIIQPEPEQESEAAPGNETSTQDEHDKCIAQLREWGLAG